MPLGHDAPDEGFMRELREVARDAIALNEPLTKPLNFDLPQDFPKSQLIDICCSLAQLPDGTAEGSRAALEYARNRLPAIRRQHVLSEELDVSGGDLPPPVLREALIDQRLKNLIASVSTALDEYRRLAAEEPAGEPQPEAAIPPVDEACRSKSYRRRDHQPGFTARGQSQARNQRRRWTQPARPRRIADAENLRQLIPEDG